MHTINIAISSAGISSAQGNVTKILAGELILEPSAALPWETEAGADSQLCRPAIGIAPELKGAKRWRALALAALEECLANQIIAAEVPLIVGTCNGGIDGFEKDDWQNAFEISTLFGGTRWEKNCLPLVSGSCASGMQALFLGTQMIYAGFNEVIVLAVDILSTSNCNNFESLRILCNNAVPPWNSVYGNILLGEAAVALHLVNNNDNNYQYQLYGPLLGCDIGESKRLTKLLQPWQGEKPDFILGQGTGPAEIDNIELQSLQAHFDLDIPLSTPHYYFGHTLGASGLLSVALSLISLKAQKSLLQLEMPIDKARDGRSLLKRDDRLEHSAMIVCRAVSGACATVYIAVQAQPYHYSNEWQEIVKSPPLSIPFLRQFATEAVKHRPKNKSDIIIVFLEEPLTPPSRLFVGNKLLPSAVLEITPSYIPQLLAGCWGYDGAAICVVGGQSPAILKSFRHLLTEVNLSVNLISITGKGEEREIEWHE
jgi:3-oxoacyl-[acyl-carrier-protein] synthase-1